MVIRNIQKLSRERLINIKKLFQFSGLDEKVMGARLIRRGSSINDKETTALKTGMVALVGRALEMAGIKPEELLNAIMPPFGGQSEAFNRQRRENAVDPIYYLTTRTGNLFSVYRAEDRFLPRTTAQPKSHEKFYSLEAIFKFLEKEDREPTPKQEIIITERGKSALEQWLLENSED